MSSCIAFRFQYFAGGHNEADVIAVDQVVLIPDPDPESRLWGHVDHDPACAGD